MPVTYKQGLTDIWVVAFGNINTAIAMGLEKIFNILECTDSFILSQRLEQNTQPKNTPTIKFAARALKNRQSRQTINQGPD